MRAKTNIDLWRAKHLFAILDPGDRIDRVGSGHTGMAGVIDSGWNHRLLKPQP